MSFLSLRDFIEHLEKKGELVRISQPASTFLEMTEIGDRLVRTGGPAVLFENAVNEFAGKKYENSYTNKVLINLFCTVGRVAEGLGVKKEELRELGRTLAFLRQPEPPGGWKEAVNMLPLLKKVMSMQPKNVRTAPCQEVVLTGDEIDLNKLPIQGCWPGEPAPLITWPLVVTAGPTNKDLKRGQKPEQAISSEAPPSADLGKSAGDKTDSYNIGIYRMQVLNKNQTLMRWLKHRGGAEHYRKWKQQKETEKNQSTTQPLNHSNSQNSFPVAVVLGADPGTILAAVTPVPDTMSEYQFAGFLRGKGVELVDCKTIPLKVPAHAEIILEGHVSLDDYRPEGPYGDHTGYYNSVEMFPVFTVTAITMRKNPIYLSTYTGKPPDEPSILGEALNEIFIPILQQQFPEIIDFYLPPEGCSYRIAVVSIKKSYPGHAKRVMLGIWSFLRQFIYTKWVIVVDGDINIRDWKEVMWAISTRMDFGRDMTVIENTPIDYLDFASPESGLGAKLGFDATNKLPPETHREWGKKIEMDLGVKEKIDKLWQEMGFKE